MSSNMSWLASSRVLYFLQRMRSRLSRLKKLYTTALSQQLPRLMLGASRDAMLSRAREPIRAREPLSGIGAQLHGGRFNPKGIPALYTSVSVMTAIRETNQIGTLQPIVTWNQSCHHVFETAFGVCDEGTSGGNHRTERHGAFLS